MVMKLSFTQMKRKFVDLKMFSTKVKKNSRMNETEFHSYEVVLKENEIDYWI